MRNCAIIHPLHLELETAEENNGTTLHNILRIRGHENRDILNSLWPLLVRASGNGGHRRRGACRGSARPRNEETPYALR